MSTARSMHGLWLKDHNPAAHTYVLESEYSWSWLTASMMGPVVHKSNCSSWVTILNGQHGQRLEMRQ